MIVENIPVLIGTALPLMASPGPATVALAATGATVGIARGLAYLAGVCVGVMGILLAVATGFTGLLIAVPGLVPVVVAIALVYILYLAWRIATAPVLSADEGQIESPSFAGGLIVAVANPKAYAAMASAFAATTLIPTDATADGLAKYALISVLIWTVNSSWLAFGSAFAALLRNERTARTINVTFAILLLVSVSAVAWDRLH